MPVTASHNALMCSLCLSNQSEAFYRDQYREYVQCVRCHLVFVPPQYYISREEEKAQYDSHQNFPHDPAYRTFLSRLFDPMLERISPQSCGLDFGSGPGPTLSVMFEEAGHRMALYDPHYAPETAVLDQPYDFVTTTEVVEHLKNPQQDLNRLWQCLKPGGYLGIMTKLVMNREAFVHWHYKNEPTHIAFYSRGTFQWLAGQWKATLEFFGRDVMIFQKGKPND